jgi:hypothetical protein
MFDYYTVSNVCQIFFLATIDTMGKNAYTLNTLDTNIEHAKILEVDMEAALEMRTKTEKGSSRVCSTAFSNSTCPRCGGLMVGDFCMDLLKGSERLEVLASRCVQCGEVVDPVILQNRKIQHPSSTYSLFGSLGTNT